jgi:CBS domain-containing protein
VKLEALVGGSAEVVGPEATVDEAAAAMVELGVGAVAVVDGNKLVGIFTERDVMRAVAEEADLEEEAVGDWMTPAPDLFAPTVDVDEAAAWILETGYRHLPVMDNGELLGIVSIRDLLWAMVEGED